MCTAYTAAGDANDQHPLALPRTHPHPARGERMSGEGEACWWCADGGEGCYCCTDDCPEDCMADHKGEQ